MMRQSLRTEIQELGPWFHNIHLPNGEQTAPNHFFGDFPNVKWRQIATHLPSDLNGMRVLDIGCNAGFYSFELAARGARVVGIDMDDRYLRQARWAASEKGLEARVSFEKASVYDVTRLSGRFDIILFMGVFYHLRHPLLALDLLDRLAPDILVFQTLTHGSEDVSAFAARDVNFQSRHRLADPGWPSMAFVEGTFSGDPTNWWIPNHAAVEAMLRSAGFRIAARPGHEIYLCNHMGDEQRAYVDEAHRAPDRIAGSLGGQFK